MLGLQRSSRLLPSRAAARSLVRAASDPAQHDAVMASFYAGQHLQHGEPAVGPEPSSVPPAQATPGRPSSSAHSRGSCASQDALQAGGSAAASEQEEDDRLLAEAASFGADGGDTNGWVGGMWISCS